MHLISNFFYVVLTNNLEIVVAHSILSFSLIITLLMIEKKKTIQEKSAITYFFFVRNGLLQNNLSCPANYGFPQIMSIY